MRFTWIFALIGDWLIALFHPKLPKREQLELSDYDSIDSRYCEVPPTSYYSYFPSLCLHFGKGCEHKEDEGLLNSHTLHLSIDTIELVNAGGADPQYAPDISVWASSLPRPYSVASDEPRIYLHQMVPGAGPEIASTNVHARSGGNSPEDYSTKIHAAFGGDGAGEKPPLSKNNGVLRGTALDFIPENSPWEYRPPQSSLPHFPSLPPPDLLSLPNPSLSCSRDFASSFSSPSPTVTCTPSPTLCSPRESAQSFTPPPRGLPSFDRQRIMPWPCEGSGDDVLDMDSLKLLKQASVYDLLQSSQIPFISTVDMVKPCTFGVVLISFIPYTVTRQEVISFVGSDSQYLANHNGASPIHITMERSTGKTMECYIEFVSDEAAARFARRLNSAYDASTSPRMGQRYVEVSLSSQNTLLKAIFPLAKCIKWVNASPVMLDEIPEWSSGFDGFLTDEEVFCLGRHSDSPHRSVFSSRVPQRSYECMISTIWKFPWYATGMYTVHARNQIFELLKRMVINLRNTVRKNTQSVGLDERLLRELAWCGILCPGFNPRQKYSIAWKSGLDEFLNLLDHDWCLYFPFDTLSFADDRQLHELQKYAYLMSKGSIDRASTELDGYHNRHVHPKVRRLFGINWFQWNEDAAKKVLFKDSIDYEKCIHRQFIIAAYREIHQIPRSGNKSSTSTGHGSPTTTERSSDSQRTISALPRAASAVPAPAYPCYPTFIEQVPYDQESSSAQQTSESRSLQTRSDRPLSSPDVLSTVQSSSSGHPEPMDSRILQSHPRRHVSYPEVCDLIRLHPQESTDGEDLQTGDERSCGESLLSTPRPSRTALNYTNTNFPRPGFPKETDLTVKEGKRRIEQLDNEEYDPFFPLPDEPQMVNSQDRTEFDREWRFPYAQGVTDVPPPSFVPLHRAMPRCEHPQSQQPQSLSLQTQQLHFQQYQAQPYYNQPYQDQQYHDPHLQAQQLQCEQYQAQAYQFQQYQAQQLQAQKEQAKEQVQEQQAHDQQAQKQQTQPPQVPPVALYRIPHHRATSSSYSQAPIYHVPHATAQNIRSHSDPFAPGPYETSGTRSQSDVPSVVPLVNTPYFDNVRQGQRERRDWRETHNDANK